MLEVYFWDVSRSICLMNKVNGAKIDEFHKRTICDYVAIYEYRFTLSIRMV